jgi:4-amino-4-deoxy-L-arabinose transferase-like glycosyltransferase
VSSRREALLPVAVVLVLGGAVFGWFARFRPLDPDEGAYAIASRLVLDGELPYVDFVFTQMPLLPFVYGGWLGVAGESWGAMRLLSVLIALATAIVLVVLVTRRFGRTLGLVVAVLYPLTTGVYSWHTTAKTYALSSFLLVCAFALVAWSERPSRRRWVAAGICCALAVDVRLLFLAAVPALALAAGRTHRRAFASGLALGLLPALALFALDPEVALFDVLGTQATRSESGLIGDVRQKWVTTFNLFGVGSEEGAAGVQFFVLALLAFAALALALRERRGLPLAPALAVSLGVVSLLPTPTFPQYFVVTYPFLLFGAVELVVELRARLRDPPAVRALGAVSAAAAVLYGAAGVVDLIPSSSWVSAADDNTEIDAIEDVSRTVDSLTAPGEEVLAWWPGYLVGSHAESALDVLPPPDRPTSLSQETSRRYDYPTVADVERLLRERAVRVIVFRRWYVGEPETDWAKVIADSGYRLEQTRRGAAIYVAP